VVNTTGAAGLQAEIHSRLGHFIKRAEQALMTEKSDALREFELTVPQYAALLALSYTPSASGAQLARICVVTPQTMATVLANLESKGLIEREPSSIHQRVLVTRLTRTGRALVKRADQKARAVEERLGAAFSEVERDQLRGLLERAIAALHDREPAPAARAGRRKEKEFTGSAS
jgi:DNA-binding MarR family transcriptional regulator